jgi:3-oxoacyl-[acyl-carrier-protein] synthase-3
MVKAAIKAIEYFLPEGKLTNEDLEREFPEWSVSKIEEKTGISERHIAEPNECASDLAVAAAVKLFATGVCAPEEIDYTLLCTQSPDYFLPTTACLIQERLGITTSSGALDFNLGCSGYVYGLGLAKGLVETGQARKLLLLTAETYSKFIHRADKSVRTIFGDAAAATLVEGLEATGLEREEYLGPFVYGTDGKGADNLIVPVGGMRGRAPMEEGKPESEGEEELRTPQNLYMNGSEIFTFTLDVVPKTVRALLERSDKRVEDIDLFVFHQANRYMLDHLRRKMKLPEERFYISLGHCGNTVSCTIPIALKEASVAGKLNFGDLVMAVGFGVGYSWGGALIRWASTSPRPSRVVGEAASARCSG